MIHDLEFERQQFDEALEVLRRLYRIRKPSESDLEANRQVAEPVLSEGGSALKGKARRVAAGGQQRTDEA